MSTGMRLRAATVRLAASLWLVWLLSLGVACSATVYDCGPGKTYTTLGAVPWMNLGPGDTVNIYWRSTPYFEKILLSGRGTPTQPIRIVGIPGPNGQLPIIDGQNATTSPSILWHYQGTATRGLVVVSYNANQPYGYKPGYIEINGLEMRNAYVANKFTDGAGVTQSYTYNAAGLFVERGEHIVVRGCMIDGNGNGLFVASAASLADQAQLSKDILVEGCSIWGNSNIGRDREHNVYTEAQGTVFQYNYFGRPRAGAGGNNLKDRSSGTIIRYNWFEGGAHMMDLVEAQEGWPVIGSDPAYLQTYVYGNVMLNTNGDGAYAIHYGGDQGFPYAYRNGTLYFYNNTVIIRCDQTGTTGARWRTTLFQLTSNTQTLDARNNIIYFDAATAGHTHTDINMCLGAGILNFGTNWVSQGWQPTRPDLPSIAILNGTNNFLTNATNNPGFVKLAALTSSLSNSDVHLAANSPCIDMSMPLAPAVLPLYDVVSQYLAPQTGAPRAMVGSAMDLGAYEGTTGGTGPLLPTISLLTLSPSTVTGGSSATGTVTLSGNAPTGGAAVALFSSDAAATVPATITVPAGSSSATFTVTTTQVSTATPAIISAGYNNSSQTATLSIQPPVQGNPTVTSVSLSPSTVTGGSSSTGTVTLSGNAPTGGAVVNLSSNDASATVPASITVPAGQASATFTVTTSQVASATQAVITADYNSSSQTATLSVQPPVQNNVKIASLILDVGNVIGGDTATGTVTLSSAAPAGGQVVTLSSNNTAAGVPASVTVAAGQTQVTFTVTSVPVAAQINATITGTSGGVNQTDTLQVRVPYLNILTLNPTTVKGTKTSTATVALAGPAGPGGIVVTLTSSNTTVATVPTSVKIAAGQTRATFTVTAKTVTANKSITITAKTTTTRTSTLTVTP